MREILKWEDKGPRAHVPRPRWRRQQSPRSPVVWGRAQLPSTLGTFLLHHNLFWAGFPSPCMSSYPQISDCSALEPDSGRWWDQKMWESGL